MSETDFSSSKSLFLGFDLSTQQLKIIVTNEDLKALKTYNVEFDSQFKEKYKVYKGVITPGDDGEIVSPVAMWLDAIDFLMDKMLKDKFPFDKVIGISGSGQQHGSVYWSEEADKLLKNLDPKKDLSEQLQKAFSWEMSPNWQDHSTIPEANAFHKAVGGKENLAKITGSRAHLRFTGLQIRKFVTRSHQKEYAHTSRISLVSSFVTSILLGKIDDIEQSDGCGMNLYDIEKSQYDDELLAVAAGVHTTLDHPESKQYQQDKIEELKQKLGKIKPITYESSGPISNYFTEKYGFSSKCKIYSFTGDNLATILSLPLQPNDCLISLGTSTTVLLITQNYNPSSQYHLFDHPTMPKHYMGMICYSNGSVAREKIRDEVNKKYEVKDHTNWSKFDEILEQSEGKPFDDKLGIYFPIGEIVPQAPAQTIRAVLSKDSEQYKVKKCKLDTDGFTVDDDALAIVESQTLSCRLRSGPMLSKSSVSQKDSKDTKEYEEIYDKVNKKFGKLYTDGKEQTRDSLLARPNKCYYVGGASNNQNIINKMGSILGPVEGNYKVEIPNACALGGAYKASWSHECETQNKHIPYDEYIKKLFDVNQELESFKVVDQWIEYFDGVGMLAKMEEELLVSDD